MPAGSTNMGNRMSTVLARQLGGQLLGFREAAGLNQSQAAEVLSCLAGKIAKMERGWVPFRDPDVIALCKLYGVDDEQVVSGLLRLAKLDRERRRAKGWWVNPLTPGNLREYIAMEDVARRVRIWQLALIPGLLQTPEYTRALAVPAVSPDDIERVEHITDLRMRRQARLTGADPLHVHAVIWEAALRQLVGGAALMREQLAKLLDVASLPHVQLQVLPFRAGVNAGSGGTFNILSFREEEATDVVHMDGLRSSAWIEGVEESAEYVNIFARLCAVSLSPHDSSQLIESIAKGLRD